MDKGIMRSMPVQRWNLLPVGVFSVSHTILRREEAEGKARVQQASPFVELPPVCQEPVFQPGTAAAIIWKGSISIEVTESASAGFIAKVMEAVAHAR